MGGFLAPPTSDPLQSMGGGLEGFYGPPIHDPRPIHCCRHGPDKVRTQVVHGDILFLFITVLFLKKHAWIVFCFVLACHTTGCALNSFFFSRRLCGSFFGLWLHVIPQHLVRFERFFLNKKPRSII